MIEKVKVFAQENQKTLVKVGVAVVIAAVGATVIRNMAVGSGEYIEAEASEIAATVESAE